jgi:hypothetical protein
MAAKRQTKAQQETKAEAKLEKEQGEALGAGRSEEKDRTERTPAMSDDGPGFESDTPSAVALAKVGNLDGEDVKHDGYAKANEHGEKYQAAKKKQRWG